MNLETKSFSEEREGKNEKSGLRRRGLRFGEDKWKGKRKVSPFPLWYPGRHCGRSPRRSPTRRSAWSLNKTKTNGETFLCDIVSHIVLFKQNENIFQKFKLIFFKRFNYRPCVEAIPPPRTPTWVSEKSTTPIWRFHLICFCIKIRKSHWKIAKYF